MLRGLLTQRLTALISILVAMVSIQYGASLAKQLFPVVGALGTATLRLLFATLILVTLWRPWTRWPSAQSWPPLALYGASLGAMNLLFYLALARIPLGVAVALEFVGPLAIALLASRRARDFLWAAMAAVGIVALLPNANVSTNLDGTGAAFALAAGACWALYIVFGKKVSASHPGGIATTWGMIGALIVTFPFGLAHAGLSLFDWRLLPLGLSIGLLSSALPYSLEMVALKRLPAQTFGVLMSVEPAIAALCGLIFLGERLTPLQMVAMGLVTAASVGSTSSAPEPERSAT